VRFALSEMRAVGVSTNRLEALQELRQILTVSTAATRLLEKLEEDLTSVRDVRDVNLAVAQRVGEVLQELRGLHREMTSSPAAMPDAEETRHEIAVLQEHREETAAALDRLQRDIQALKSRPPADADEEEEEDPARRHAREALAAFVRDGSDL
jgi:uncharacterized coiled-coil DUF342 family protein